jgi:hypothetical protein
MPKLKIEAKTITPRQAIMIAVLGAVLVAAIYWPGGDGAALDAGPGPGGHPAAARLAAQHAKAPLKIRNWPHVELESALEHDPFSSPLLTAQTASADIENDDTTTIEEQSADLLALKQDGVSMIVRDGAGMIATVGERKLRVGDVIDGYRVTAIEMDGVVLERVSKNDTDIRDDE